MKWSDFPIKTHIVDYLDYASRCNLRACSRDDLAAVDSTPFVADEISIREFPGQMDKEKTNIRVCIDSFTIWFVGKNDVTRVERAVNGNELEWKETLPEKRHDVCRRFLDTFIRDGQFRAKRITIELKDFLPSEHWTLRCDHLKLTSLGQFQMWAATWIGKVRSPLKSLDVFAWNVRGLSDLPQIVTVSEKLRIEDFSDLTDQQLEKIPATQIQISSERISLEGVKKTVHRFLKQGKRGEDLNLSTSFPQDLDPRTLFPRGVLLRKVDNNSPRYGRYTIMGGSKNVPGFDETLEFCFADTNIHIRERKRNEKPRYPCLLYPFTAN